MANHACGDDLTYIVAAKHVYKYQRATDPVNFVDVVNYFLKLDHVSSSSAFCQSGQY